MCMSAQEDGYDNRAHWVVEKSLRVRSVAMARLIFNIRRQQLARQAAAYFGNRGLDR